MSQRSHFKRMLAALYASPVEAELWDVFMSDLCQVLDVNKAALLSYDFTAKDLSMFAKLRGVDMDSLPLYEQHFHQSDEWTIRLRKRKTVARVVRGEEFWPEEELLKSGFYNDFLKKFDMQKVAGVVTASSLYRTEILTAYRGPAEDDFSAEQFSILEQLAPHLKIALYTRRKLLALETRVRDLETALDQLGCAMLLLDCGSNVVFANQEARRLLDRRDGLCLQDSKLVARKLTEQAGFRSVLGRALLAVADKSPVSPGAMQISRTVGRPLALVAAPLRSESLRLPGSAVAAVFLTDPDERALPPAEVLRMLFGLSPAETRLAMALLEGNSLAEAAELHGLGRETVRSQVKSIFQKTGARGQSDLMRMLSGLNMRCSGD